MISIRRSSERGHADHGWLDTRHTFSFADYYDPAHLGFRALRVINEDRVAPGAGFPAHSHRDMEILTWVLAGAVEHRDSLGTRAVVRAGDVQRMTAGRGVTHSEMNPSNEQPLHLLQIWIVPARRGLDPGYEQRSLDLATDPGHLRLVAAPDGRAGSLTIHQDAALYAARLGSGQHVAHELAPDRHAWLQVSRGRVALDAPQSIELEAGDGAAISGAGTVALRAADDAEILLFDLA